MVVKRKKGNAIPTYNTSRLRVGFIDSATYPDGQNVATVAFWNEYGTEKIPPRPFFRTTIANNKGKWIEYIRKVQNLDAKAGELIKGDLVFSILNWTEPGNSEYTKRKKGFDAPLRDTGQMSRSISYELTSDSE